MQDPSVTLTWMEWLNGRDEDHSCWFDFMETPRIRETRWFWIAVAIACVVIVTLFLSSIL